MSDNSSKNISYKLSMALSAASLVKLKTDKIDLTSNRLVLVTAAGTICGNFVSDNDSDYQEDPEYLFMKQISSQAAQFSSQPPNSILLSNVEIVSSNGSKSAFNYLHVFTDDIIGISFGDIN